MSPEFDETVTDTWRQCHRYLTTVSSTPDDSVTDTWRQCHRHLTIVSLAPDYSVTGTWRQCHRHLTRMSPASDECHRHLTTVSPAPDENVTSIWLDTSPRKAQGTITIKETADDRALPPSVQLQKASKIYSGTGTQFLYWNCTWTSNTHALIAMHHKRIQ